MQKLTYLIVAAMAAAGCTKVQDPAPVYPIPNEHQLAWHDMEQYAFIHFTTNTFTGREWGFGDESEEIFNPTGLDARQWVQTIKDAGLKGLILTTKHHDGFCLWPSKYTEHSVKKSPFRNGDGDVVKEVADACREAGIKFGVYLSPWDRNHPQYGSPEYVEYYRNQLAELIDNYGPMFEIWFDGANGGDGYYGGTRETRRIDGSTYYDWKNTLQIPRQKNPETILFSDAGPDIRWCGNESGYIGETNWCTITTDTLFAGKAGINTLLNEGAIDGAAWVPAEVDVSIRPGWFYHESEDSLVRTPENLFKIYLESVGRGANLLLNLPPDQRGLIHENDVKALRGWREMIDKAFANNLAANAEATADSYRGNAKKFAPANLTDGDKTTYWATDDDVTAGSVEVALNAPAEVNYIVLQEYLPLGQRVKAFDVEVLDGDRWKPVYSGTTIGHKRIIPTGGVNASKVRLNITDAKACPTIHTVEVY